MGFLREVLGKHLKKSVHSRNGPKRKKHELEGQTQEPTSTIEQLPTAKDLPYPPTSSSYPIPMQQAPLSNQYFFSRLEVSPPQMPMENAAFFDNIPDSRSTGANHPFRDYEQASSSRQSLTRTMQQSPTVIDVIESYNDVRGNVQFLHGLPIAPQSTDLRKSQPGPSSEAADVPELSSLFYYAPLQKDPLGMIRLIRLDSTPALGSTDLNYTITSFNPWHPKSNQSFTTEVEGFHCLSYCWGENKKTRKIYLRPSSDLDATYDPLPVTDNLYSALRSLTITHPSTWFWIDAISINQDDLEERSAQVSIMKQIYNRASGVVIWLGESEATSPAYSVICDITDYFVSKTAVQTSEVIGAEGFKLTLAHLDLLAQSTRRNVAKKAPMNAYEDLADFFSLPWFRRVWVLQEALSLTTVVAYMGATSVPWGSIILAAIWQSFLARKHTINSDGLSQRAPQPGRGYLPELWLGLVHSRIPRGLGIVELACRVRDFEASDPRDKVFGLLGLANDVDAETEIGGFHPDYTKSKTDVYCDFAQDSIRKSGTLEVLSAVDSFTNHLSQDDSPSWMPNFDHPIATIRGLGFPPKYDAAFSTKASGLIPPGSNIGLLKLSGFILDTVSAKISGLLTVTKDLRLHHNGSPCGIEKLYSDFVTPHYDPSAESTLLAFIYTLTATGFARSTQFPAHPLGQVIPPQQAPPLRSDFAAYMHKNRAGPQVKFPRIKDQDSLAVAGDADQFAVLVGKACHERKFFITQDGQMGLCPRNSREGDKVVILYGGSVPYVLRQSNSESWTFVGECYVDRYMFGEAEKARGSGEKFERTFSIF